MPDVRPLSRVMDLELHEGWVVDVGLLADRALPADVRAVFTFLLAGYSFAELAALMGISPSALHGRLNVSAGTARQRVCEWCGAPLSAGGRRHAKTCSARCRVALSRSGRSSVPIPLADD